MTEKEYKRAVIDHFKGDCYGHVSDEHWELLATLFLKATKENDQQELSLRRCSHIAQFNADMRITKDKTSQPTKPQQHTDASRRSFMEMLTDSIIDEAFE